MNVTGIVILLVLVLLAVGAVALILAAKRRARSEELQGRFGPEYDRAIDEHGDRKAAESHLADVADRRDALEIRDLAPEERERFSHRWLAVQTAFVDDPSGAVRDADHLVAEVMRERGYPVDDFDTKVDMVAADHPLVAEHYRAAHTVGSRVKEHGTEDQRQAFVHYRALFAELLDDGDHGRHADGVNRSADASPRESSSHDGDDLDLTANERSPDTPRPE
ncbi:MAG: hypothetical protein ACXV2H_02335 [Actinomycetes bacterium]